MGIDESFVACLIFRSLSSIVICNRKTPFANGPADAPDAILKRINDSKVQLDSGHWASVSNDAKVFLKSNHGTKLWISTIILRYLLDEI